MESRDAVTDGEIVRAVLAGDVGNARPQLDFQVARYFRTQQPSLWTSTQYPVNGGSTWFADS